MRRILGVCLFAVLVAVPASAQDEQLFGKVYLTSWTGATVSSASGAPSDAEPNGSIYLRTDTGQVYQRIAGAWVPLTDASGKIPALSSTYITSLSGANLTSLPAGQLTGTIASGVQDNITRTGTVTSGTWSGLFGTVSAANLTNLTAANLTGTIASAVQDAITRLGTITSGVWNAGAVTTTALTVSGGSTLSDITLNGNFTGSLMPASSDAYDIGRYDRLWGKAFISTLVALVFEKATATLFGGYSIVGKQSGSFDAAVTSGATTINFGQTMTPGDWVLVRAHDTAGTVKAEYLTVGTLSSGTTYNVTRDLDASHATDPAWADGTPFLVLGASGDGRIDMLAYDGKPRTVYGVQGATYNAFSERCVIGNLNGYYSYATDVYGLACGDAAAANVTTDPTNGFRVRHGTTNRIALNADGSGSLANGNIAWNTAGTLTAAGWTLGATTLTGGSVTIDSAGNIRSGQTAYNTGTGFWLGVDSATPKLSIGSSSSSLTWDGSAVTITGASLSTPNITIGTDPLAYAASSAMKFTRDSTLAAQAAGDRYALYAYGQTNQRIVLENTYVPTNPTSSFADVDGYVTLRATGWDPIGGVATAAASVELTSGVNTWATITSGSTLRVQTDGLVLSGPVYERGRYGAAAMGEWISVTYNAGNFTNGSGGTWTVDSADQLGLSYTLVGKTMTVSFDLRNTDVSLATGELRVAIPAGFVAAAAASNNIVINNAGAGFTAGGGRAFTVAGGSYIAMATIPGTWTVTAADNTSAIGSISFAVQ